MVSAGKVKLWLAVVCVIILLVVFLLAPRLHDHSDVLWKFVSQQCVPEMEKNHRPAPCEKVDLAAGYVLFKDRVGPLQYLLMPVAKISGIESPGCLIARLLISSLLHGMNGICCQKKSVTGARQRSGDDHQFSLGPDTKSITYTYVLPSSGYCPTDGRINA